MFTLQTFTVTLNTPMGQGQIDVPTTLGAEAAGRRAIVAAIATGWGDFEDVTVESVEIAQEEI